jgi:D-glycero-alpha-D-manno-heptose 1-phosphate guanylyltransferase
MITEALILAGGLGTRLRNVVKDVPKPLAPINGTPFLTLLIRYLKPQGINHVILSVGYKHELIEEIYGNSFEGIQISYAVEQTPLGTGGGIALGLSKALTDNVLVLNGDSFIRFELDKLREEFAKTTDKLLIVLKSMRDFDRYGVVKVDGGKITAFEEKRFVAQGLINAGVYVMNKAIFSLYEPHLTSPIKSFSFEKDFLEKYVFMGNFHAHICEDYFIDIGIEEDYAKAQNTLIANIYPRA